MIYLKKKKHEEKNYFILTLEKQTIHKCKYIDCAIFNVRKK